MVPVALLPSVLLVDATAEVDDVGEFCGIGSCVDIEKYSVASSVFGTVTNLVFVVLVRRVVTARDAAPSCSVIEESDKTLLIVKMDEITTIRLASTMIAA